MNNKDGILPVTIMDLSNNIICEEKCKEDKDKDKKPNILLFSPLFFATNIVTAFVNEYYLYSGLFCFLTLTSVIYHSNNNIYTNVIDKIAIILIVLYGAYILYNKIKIDLIDLNNLFNLFNLFKYSIIIFTFLGCIYLYYYGFVNKQYCFCDDDCIAYRYHFLMHIIVSIGHHFIIFL